MCGVSLDLIRSLHLHTYDYYEMLFNRIDNREIIRLSLSLLTKCDNDFVANFYIVCGSKVKIKLK